MRSDSDAAIRAVEVNAYRIPTDGPESDGTLEWNSTTLVLVRITAGGRKGIGYSYADAASATLVREVLGGVIEGRDALQTAARASRRWRSPPSTPPCGT